ncbi:DUF1540 domain-containing protein [Halalkalibacter sp. APA_J-10(15)]|uniref:DUF1540 domain-containing protein n=1 Tax=Halalkalibacter sp. APA_J-10(15) TaxID=2933805 RepID=UPI001FF4D31A|nr:DUF1540 domain-containing protein [Halalkalibacter sp. APA_J-10(15)]MCK0471535.1 DUF1540 domain-containing protein [Halalkalibacter sp. APA_J-10(15)]
MAKPVVKCHVSNCSYWGNGNRCQAEAILVEMDAHAERDYSAEFSEELSEQTNHAQEPAQTCCHTFKPKCK